MYITLLYAIVDTEQQEILELILRNLGEAELYYLRALLMVSNCCFSIDEF